MKDEPVEMSIREAMNAMAIALDKILNGATMSGKGKRENGFVLLVFPFNDKSGLCNYISNGADRKDIIKLFKTQIERFEEFEASNGEGGL